MDTELTQYASGIDMHFGNSATTATDKNTAYAIEQNVWNPALDDIRTVYIRADTPITLSRNASNRQGNPNGSDSYVIVGLAGTERIVFMPDGDRRNDFYVSSWQEYTAPFTFASLNYGIFGAAGTQVVGSTGSTLPFIESTRLTYYHRGILDAVGDEWHIITVADDGSALSGVSGEFRASDSKITIFVVNPKTPCLIWRVTGNGQFYTTPAKTHLVPFIYDQTTYFNSRSGTTTCEIRNIYAGNVFYRIVASVADAVTAYTDAGANNVTLDQDDFPVGVSYLQYYYAGNAAFKKTRKVVKNPAYPSAGETHGDKLWINAGVWDALVRPKILIEGTYWLNRYRTEENHNFHSSMTSYWPDSGRGGWDNCAFKNALVARVYGMTYPSTVNPTKTYAEFAKMAILSSALKMDPVGITCYSAGPSLPCRELIYRGYNDVKPFFEAMAAYDVIAGYFREDQGYAAGLTPIEDYFIRDQHARWVHRSATSAAGYGGAVFLFDRGGMWDTAPEVGSAMACGIMPKYSTRYYGTSGQDGVTTATFNDVVYPTLNHTWFAQTFRENVAETPLQTYPGLSSFLGLDRYMFELSGGDYKWHDRTSYISEGLMGYALPIYRNIAKLFAPTRAFPIFDAQILPRAAAGTLYGVKVLTAADANPVRRMWGILRSNWFSDFREDTEPYYTPSVAGDQAQSYGTFGLIWLNHDMPDPSDAFAAPPIATPAARTFESNQSVTLSSATADVSIYYTLDGSSPDNTKTLFIAPIAINGVSLSETTVTLKCISRRLDGIYSEVATHTFLIDLTGKPAPTINPFCVPL